MRIRFTLLTLALAASCPHQSHAEILNAKPGDNLALIAAKAKPGDEIVLAAGVYGSTTLTNIRGEAGKLITIRGPKGQPFFAEFDAKNAAYALRLEQCAFIQVQDLIMWDAADAALEVKTLGPKSEQVMLRNIGFGCRNSSRDSIGIRVSGVRGLTIDQCRVNGVTGAAVHIEHTEQAIISALDCSPRPKSPQQVGIIVAGPSQDVIITRCVFRWGVKTTLSIGVQYEPAEILEAIPLVNRCTVTEVRADAPSCFLELGSVTGLKVSQSSVLDAQGKLYSITAPPKDRPGVEGNLDHLLFTWTPGFLKQFASVDEKVDASKLTLGANLFWSEELPQAMKILGTMPGTLLSPQITNVDPKIDTRGVATNPAARGFGLTDPGPSKPA